MVGFRNAISACACSQHAGDERAHARRRCRRGRRRRRTRCARRGSSETCRCVPEPPWSLNGLPMNVATSPFGRRTSLTAAFRRNARSAAVSASAWRRLISYWLFMNSWFDRERLEAQRRQRLGACRARPAGIDLRADGVDHARAGRRGGVRRRRRSRSTRKNSSSGPTIGSRPSSREARPRTPHARRADRRSARRRRPARGRPGSTRRPAPTAAPPACRGRAARSGRGSPPRRPPPACGAGRCPSPPSRSTSPLSATRVELADRHVLAARDPVQVGVDDANRADRRGEPGDDVSDAHRSGTLRVQNALLSRGLGLWIMYPFSGRASSATARRAGSP